MNFANQEPNDANWVDARSIEIRHCLEQLLRLVAETEPAIEVTISGMQADCKVEPKERNPFQEVITIKLEHLYVLGEKLAYISGVEAISNNHLLIPFRLTHHPKAVGKMMCSRYSASIKMIQWGEERKVMLAHKDYYTNPNYAVEQLILDSKHFRRPDCVTIMFDDSLLEDCDQVF